MLIQIVPAAGTLGITAVPAAGSQSAGEFLARYLVDDLQGSVTRAREVLIHLDDVSVGREPAGKQSGNAYDFTAKPEGVILDFQWAEDGQAAAATVPLDAVRKAAQGLIEIRRRVLQHDDTVSVLRRAYSTLDARRIERAAAICVADNPFCAAQVTGALPSVVRPIAHEVRVYAGSGAIGWLASNSSARTSAE